MAALATSALASSTAALAGCSSSSSSTTAESTASHSAEERLSAAEALERLKHGNDRFAKGNSIHPDEGSDRRKELTSGQHPIATVLSCVDSRVPPELIFDEGLGDLFVIRTAGQVVDHAVMGSLQFGVHELEIPLLIVLGHSSCGAIKATIEAVEKNSASTNSDVDALVAALKPAVEKAKDDKPKDLVAASVKVNVENVLDSLHKAAILGQEAQDRKLTIVGATYDLATGVVTFMED